MKNKQAWNYIIAFLVVLVIIFLAVKFGAKKIVVPTNNQMGSTHVPGWSVFTDPAKGMSFEYPADLGTKYINAVDWPPLVSITSKPFTCTEGGVPTQDAGERKIITISGNTYCVSKLSQGAAGSTYNSFIYINELKGKTRFLVFTLQYVQCDNYPDPQKSECKAEQASFDIAPTIDKIFSTIIVTT